MNSTVSIRKTCGNDFEDIREAVDRVIEDLGGLEDIISPGDRVIIKPNMVAVPMSRLSGAVTRWEVCLAIYEAVKFAGGTPVIAESASVGADTEDVILMCGYNRLRENGVPVVDLKSKDKQGGEKCRLVIDDAEIAHGIITWELVRDADAVITVPVMKTHDQTEITLGMKNLKGLLADDSKKKFHRDGLIESVVDLNAALKPCLEIVDGTFAAEGTGPVFGETKEMDLIIGSKDIVACEAVTGKIMGYEPAEVPITAAAAARGLGTMDLSEIDIAGERIADVASRFVRSCETKIDGVADSFRMVLDESACTGCRNTVVSVLIDMKEAGLLKYTEGLTVIAGRADDSMIDVRDMVPEKTVCIGACAKKFADRYGLRWAEGCPPRNRIAIDAIVGGREEYDGE